MAEYKKVLSSSQKTKPKGLFLNENKEDVLSINTKFELIELDKIQYNNTSENIDETILFIQTHGQINPVFVIPETKKEDKFGTTIQKKTGMFVVLSGEEIVESLNRLFVQTKEVKYSVCQCIVLSETLSQEEQNEIISAIKKEERETIEQTVSKTKGKDIEFCYDFEEVRIEPEKLQSDYNAFTYTQEEIEALSDSILHFGMWDLPLILPKIEEDNTISYQIIAGHKRTTAVLHIKEKAKNNEYEGDNQQILNRLQTIKVRLLPLGATQEQIEAVHEYSNLMRRQLTVEQGLDHIHMIRSLPPVPTSQEEYEHLISEYSMQSLVRLTESYFKGLGWNNWKDRKTSRFLTMYYFGCEEIQEAFKDKNCPINQKSLIWIVTTYKSFDEQYIQKETLEKALRDPMYLQELMSYSTKRRNTGLTNYSTIHKQLLHQRDQIRKWLSSGIETTTEENEKIRKTIDELKSEIEKLEANCRLF